MNETHLLCERRRNTEEDAAEIMQADFQSSGLFCFVTTKRIYLNFWGGFCICELLCVYIKILFGQDQSSERFNVISTAPEWLYFYSNYFCVYIKTGVHNKFCLLERCFLLARKMKCYIFISQSCRMTEKHSHIDVCVLMSKQVATLVNKHKHADEIEEKTVLYLSPDCLQLSH